VSKKPKKSETASVIGDRVYESTRIRDKSGKLRTSRGNGDAVARAMLLHKSKGGELDAIINANKLQERMKKHAKMQDGLRRMTLGVMLRALVRNGTPVKIGGVTVEKLTQKVELPKVEIAARSVRSTPKGKKARKSRKSEVERSEGDAA